MLIKSQLRAVRRQAFYASVRFRKLIGEQFGKKMFFISEADKYRLLMLDVWAERHAVDWDFILGILIPYYQNKFKTSKKTTLGVRIPTLVGRKSEAILVSAVAKQFPGNTHVEQQRFDSIEEILDERERVAAGGDDELSPKVKGPLDFRTIDAYMSYYDRKVTRGRRRLEDAINDPENKKRNYRGSPWKV